MQEWMEVLDPTGEEQQVELEPASRLKELGGKPIGYLDNNKWNAEPLLRAVHERLKDRYGAGEMIYARKRLFSQVAPPETYDRIEREAKGAITAVGDWGSSVARNLEMNGGGNCFGQGNRANATIGRALRLVLSNVGGGLPGVADKSTFGHPGKYTYCIAENDAENPWPPLHGDRGFSASDSAVTVLACEAPHSVSDHVSGHGRGILTTIADSLATIGSNNMYAMGEAMVLLGPEHARTLYDEGWSRPDIQEFLYEKARRSIKDLSRGGMYSAEFRRAYWPRWIDETDPDEMVPVVRAPSDILLTVAGGTGKFSVVIPGWGDFGTRAVTRKVERVSQ